MKKLLSILFTIISINALGVEVRGDMMMMISENDTLYVEEIKLNSGLTLTNEGTIYVKKRISLGVGARFINNGTIYVDTTGEISLDMSSTFTNEGRLIFKGNFFPTIDESDTAFVNNGYIECNNFKYKGFGLFIQNGFFFCHQDFDYYIYYISKHEYGVSVGDSSSIVARNVNIERQGNSDIKLGGSWKCEDINITLNDSGGMLELGDIKCKKFRLNNACSWQEVDTTNLQFNGESHIEKISISGYMNVTVNVNGFLAVGNIHGGTPIQVSSPGMVSLCYNPTSEKDYRILNDGGLIFYRGWCGINDSYYWPPNVSVPEEVEIKKGFVMKNEVSYDECMTRYPFVVDEVASSDFAVVGGMVYSAGEIVVYNVAGKAIASAFQAFNVNSLGAGVYFIVAEEGTIKFVK